MSRLDDTIISRLVVLGNFATPEQVEECRAFSDSQGRDGPSLGDLLVERGYLSQEVLDRILLLRRQKVRRLCRDEDEAIRVDRDFAVLALSDEVVGLSELESALLEQQKMRGLNLHFSLAEVLLSRGGASAPQILRLLALLDKRTLRCPGCDCHYRVVGYSETEPYRCRVCGAKVVPTSFLDASIFDEELSSSELHDSSAMWSENGQAEMREGSQPAGTTSPR